MAWQTCFMGGRTHMSFGALSFAILAGPVASATGIISISLPWMFFGLFIGAVAGLLPDIDEPNAKLGRGGWMPKRLGPLFKLFAVIVSLPFRLLGYLIKGVLGHRGGTHSLSMSFFFTLCFAIPLTLAFGQTADWVILTIWCGFISHLVADMMNPSGVPLLWPLFSKNKRFHILPKMLRISTETPANEKEAFVNLLVNVLTFCIVVVFFIGKSVL